MGDDADNKPVDAVARSDWEVAEDNSDGECTDIGKARGREALGASLIHLLAGGDGGSVAPFIHSLDGGSGGSVASLVLSLASGNDGPAGSPIHLLTGGSGGSVARAA